MFVRNVWSHSSELISSMLSWVRCIATLLTRCRVYRIPARRVDDRLAVGFIRNIPGHQDCAAPGLLNPMLGRLRVVCSSRERDQDVRPLPRKRNRHGSADTGVCARNDRAALPASQPLPL